jgi:hypothetical protein
MSCPHAHKQNGSAERKYHHIVKVGFALLANASMPLKYWDDAFIPPKSCMYPSIQAMDNANIESLQTFYKWITPRPP